MIEFIGKVKILGTFGIRPESIKITLLIKNEEL